MAHYNQSNLELTLGIPQPPRDEELLRHASKRPRRAPARKLSEEDSSTIIPKPYDWATNQRARVKTLAYLVENNITTIKGDVQCKKCEKKFETSFDLMEKFEKVSVFIRRNKAGMHERAPEVWMVPRLLDCENCNKSNCVEPVISEEKEINWLFLLLGEFLGKCKLVDLKYFCQYTGHHRTGAKDRLLYLTYLELCRQLDPTGPFSR